MQISFSAVKCFFLADVSPAEHYWSVSGGQYRHHLVSHEFVIDVPFEKRI